MITEILPLNVSVPSRSMLPDKSRFVDFFFVYYTISHICLEILLLTELLRFDSCSLVRITGAPLLRPTGSRWCRLASSFSRLDTLPVRQLTGLSHNGRAFPGSTPDSIVLYRQGTPYGVPFLYGADMKYQKSREPLIFKGSFFKIGFIRKSVRSQLFRYRFPKYASSEPRESSCRFSKTSV